MGTMRHIALLASLVLVLPPAAAASSLQAPTTVADENRSLVEAVSGFAASYARSLGIPPRALKPSAGGSAGFVFPGLDLNGDGHRDLVGVKIDYERGESVIEALDGVSGETIFVQEKDGYAFPIPARVGGEGTPGLLVYSFSGEGAYVLVAGAALLQTTVGAIDATGTALWERTFHGAYVDTLLLWLVENYGAGAAAFNGIDGPAADPIVVMASDRYDPVSYESSYDTLVLDGRDGSTAYEETATGEDWSYLVAAPDLDKDDLDDLIRIGRRNGRRYVQALKGTTGEPLWDPLSIRGGGLRAVGDLTGDGTPELLATSRGCYCGFGYYESVRGHRGASRASAHTLVDGRKGRALWTEKAGALFVVGDVDGDGTRDFGIQTLQTRGNRLGVTYSAMDWKGNELFTKFYGVAGDPEAAFQKNKAVADVGDINGDGYLDSYHSIRFVDFESESFFSDEGFVSGKDGSKLRAGDLSAPLRASLDGKGDDLYRIHRGPTKHTLKITDGSDGSVLWERSLHVFKRNTRMYLQPLRGPDGRTDLLVNLLSYTRIGYLYATYLLDGGTGETIWSRG